MAQENLGVDQQLNSRENHYIIVGTATPYHSDGPIITLAEISISLSRCEVVLRSSHFGSLRCGWEIWEHTVHELETLSSSLHNAANGPFPTPIEVTRPNSPLGTLLKLPLAVEVELGYSLERPHEDRTRFFCSSKSMGLNDQVLRVAIGMSVSGGYGEVGVEPYQAVGLADWLDHQISRLW